jgi:putative ABC transport system permease protein
VTGLALKSLWSRRARALSTTFAVVIGVAFVAGSFVLTDTIFAAFDEIFSDSLKGTSVVVTAQNPVEQENGEVPTVSASLLPKVRKVAGVKLAAGAIFTPGGFFDSQGDKIGNKFAPKFISSHLPDGLESLTYVDGHPPRGPTEASLDEAAAESSGIELGESIRLIGQGSARSFRLVGFTQLGSASFGGASIAQVTLPVAQQLTHKRDRFDQISIAAEDGVSPGTLKRRIERVMPSSARVETATEKADRGSEEIRDNLGFLQTILLVFGFVAVFVGAFLIFNTFSITVAQRVAEFGLLRTLGASRRQILISVLIEALAIGLLGALIGIAGGYVMAILLNALLRAFEVDLPTTSLVMESRTIVVSLLVGVVVTSVSSLVPALRSTRVPPIAALQAYVPPSSRRRRFLYVGLSSLLALGGLAILLIGLFGGGSAGTRAAMMGGGAVAIVLAVSLFSPRLVPPLATVAGWPLERVRRLIGRLARENSQRNPSRTAITAAALMIGLALVTFVTVFSAGLKSSVAQVIDENFEGGLVIQNTDGFSPIPAGAAALARKVPGVERVATIRSTEAKLLGQGSKTKVTASTPDIGEAVEIEWKQGGPATLRELGDRESGRLGLLRFRSRARSGRQVSPAEPDGGQACLPGRGQVRLEARRLRQRPDHPTGDDPRLRPDPGHDRLRHYGARRQPGKGPAAPHGRSRTRLPDRRSAEPAGTEGNPRRTGRPARQPVQRPAPAGDRDLALRHRQHAGALDPRTHAGAGDAAGDRDVAAPGADDDPLRGGDHGADRGDSRDRPGCDLRGADLAALEGRRLHALLSDRLADRAARSRRPGRGPGRDPTGAPGFAPRRARLAPVRVTLSRVPRPRHRPAPASPRWLSR